MKMKKVILVIFFLFGYFLYGADIKLNGDFEQCKYIQGLGLWPDSWHLDKSVTKNAIVELCEDAGAVYSGKYAVSMKCEKDGRAYIYHHPLLKAENKDVLKVSVYLRGTGTFKVGFCIFGYEKEVRKMVHLTSVSSPVLQTSNGKWSKNEWTFRIPSIKKNHVVYRRFMLMPFLNLSGEGLLLVDSYEMDMSESSGTIERN